ncbi:DUF421 domain-containing protein [Janibacter cremeus]|uniref:Uncharacterized membrane protein YcaP (DUF421 family) n=1 Tax=Janibacter cremeus TaxID=1285192 RepID=A0A852VXC2_9MICO|nr:YetF domain-containing protein [Janibacter cremeus]NYF98181.1 uncharacterized membrane protein YcaP (DUF421 family) [Janibacter cremeus]
MLSALTAAPPIIDWAEIGHRLGTDPTQALAVVLSAVGIYLAFLVLVRVFGVRVLTGMGTFDVVVVITVGAVAGRVILGHPPTLAAGVIGLTCLFAMEAGFGEIRRTVKGARWVNSGPVLLMAGEETLERNMRFAHVTQRELNAALRHSGVRHPREVACVVFESTGRISVLRRGMPLDPALVAWVRDSHRIPPEFFEDS